MKKYLLAAAAAAFISIFAPSAALAAWQDDLQAAIDAGDMNRIKQVTAANPDAHGEIALILLQQAKEKATQPTPDLCFAATLFESSVPIVDKVPDGSKQEASSLIQSLGMVAKTTKNNACSTRMLNAFNELEAKQDNVLLGQGPGGGFSNPRGATPPSAE